MGTSVRQWRQSYLKHAHLESTQEAVDGHLAFRQRLASPTDGATHTSGR